MNLLVRASILVMLIASSCTNMNPDVKFNPDTDAKAYCEIGKKNSISAEKFWHKVDAAYRQKGMIEELAEFEAIILEKSQTARQQKPNIDIWKMRNPQDGEVTFYPEQDSDTYIRFNMTDPSRAQRFYADVKAQYENDGLYEEWETFLDRISIQTSQ